MNIEDRLSALATEKLLAKIDTSRCGNCEHYYPPLCLHWVECGKHIEVSENDYCDKWEADN